MSDDLISRKELGAAIDNWLAIDRYYHPYSKQKTIPVSELIDIIKLLPSAQRTGRWLKNDNGTYSCDQCHSWIPNEQHYYARYCIFCGARMEVKE